VRGATVKEVEHRDDEGDTYYTYKLYLKTNNQQIYFHDYGRNREEGLADKGCVEQLLLGGTKKSFFLIKDISGEILSLQS
jgi:hypothetical protein